MKAAWAIVIGLIVVMVGGAFMASGFSPSSQNTFNISAGQYYYNVQDVYVPAGGKLVIDYTVTGGTEVDLAVLTEQQYVQYSYDLTGSKLASTSGSTGHLELMINTAGKYYMVLDHGTGYNSQVQSGTVKYQIIGIIMSAVAIGGAILAVGVVLMIVGLVKRKKQQEMIGPMTPGQPDQGVIMYKETTLPEQPKR